MTAPRVHAAVVTGTLQDVILDDGNAQMSGTFSWTDTEGSWTDDESEFENDHDQLPASGVSFSRLSVGDQAVMQKILLLE